MKIGIAAVALLACLAAQHCQAGGGLTIRLVEASNDGDGSSSGLQDVLDMLTRNLPYKNFKLVASGSMQLPADNAARQLGNYSVACSGGQDNLIITVAHGGTEVLRTTARLRSSKPLIVGGFPTRKGKLILVFVAG